MEEWAEGKIFLHFLRHQTLLTPAQLRPVEVDLSEYLGALSDVTGELGRVAVNRAAERDFDAVHVVLQVGFLY